VARHVKSPSGRALYPVLPRGSHGIPAEQVASDQRERLQGAMRVAVAQNGYEETTVTQLVALAGVSRSSFYKHFADKEQCFLSTYDAIAATTSERVARAYLAEGDWQQRLRAAFECFIEIVITEPESSRLVLIDALGVGPHVLDHRERLTERFELLFRQCFDGAPRRAFVTDTSIKAIVAGIRRVVYRRLLRGDPEELTGLIDDLMAWALSYHAPRVKVPVRPSNPALEEPSRSLHEALADSGIEPLDPVCARRTLSQRERILRAVVAITSKGGYAGLSIPAISKTAGTSNVAFYENFESKQEAFLTAFDEVMDRAVTHTSEAFIAAGEWPAAVRAAIAALLEFVAEERIFARLAFFDILTGGPVAIDRAEHSLDAFQTMAVPGLQAYQHVPEILAEAIVGGLWNVIQHEVGYGRALRVPELTEELTYIALAPFLGAKDAARVARTPSASTERGARKRKRA
jgi:AcrR family transcriptional regulator